MDHAGRTSTSQTAAGAGPQTPEADLTGRTLGDFHVLRRLGQGGMGQVYLAEQLSLKRKVALKILKAELAGNETSLKRFQAEAEAVARITHPNIVQVYAIGAADGLHFMALEYVDGRDLRDYLARKGPPEVPLALSILRQAAAALQRAGEHGLVHRDIKPENILLTRKGEVKVADFGLSRCLAGAEAPLNLTQTGVTMGTPLYMSPEQVQGQPVDPRSDIYSLGVTGYHMLAGQPPFRGETAFQVAFQHVQARPRPLGEVRPDLPPELCAVVDRMMAKKPEDRFQNARDLLKELTRLRDSLSGTLTRSGTQAVAAGPSPPRQQAASATAALHPTGRRRLGWAAALTVVLALAGGAALGWYRHRPPPLPPLPPDPGPGDSARTSPSQQEREQFLVKAVQEYANPGDDFNLNLGLGHGIELGLLYLEQGRLEEADRFFAGLTNNPYKVKAYTTLGRLGHAIVLAFQDRAVESNQLFLAALDDKQPDRERWKTRLLLNNPKLRQMIARALNYNAANNAVAREPVPHQLQYLQRPPAFGIPGGPRRAALERRPDRSSWQGGMKNARGRGAAAPGP
jgi:serine/threonine-protein kinase